MKKTVDVENSVIILGIHCILGIPDLYLKNSMATLLQLLHFPSTAQRNACLGYLAYGCLSPRLDRVESGWIHLFHSSRFETK